jgi:hypothetical protein
MGETLADAVRHATQGDDPPPEEEYVDWREAARRLRLNTPALGDEAPTPIRPSRSFSMPRATVPASGVVQVVFGRLIRTITIQNNTAATIYRSYSQGVGPGNYAIPAGVTRDEDVEVDRVWIAAASGVEVNGPQGGGIVVEGGA